MSTPPNDESTLNAVVPHKKSGQFVALAHGHNVKFTAAFIDDIDTYVAVTTLYHQQRQASIAKPFDEEQLHDDDLSEAAPEDPETAAGNGVRPAARSSTNLTDWEYSLRERLEILSPPEEKHID